MKRRVYVLLVFVLVIGSILWFKAALIVYADRYLRVGYLWVNLIVILLVVLIAVLIFKATQNKRIP